MNITNMNYNFKCDNAKKHFFYCFISKNETNDTLKFIFLDELNHIYLGTFMLCPFPRYILNAAYAYQTPPP